MSVVCFREIRTEQATTGIGSEAAVCGSAIRMSASAQLHPESWRSATGPLADLAAFSFEWPELGRELTDGFHTF